MNNTLRIIAEWDEEASVWVAQSENVPGLVAEADTIPALITKLQVLVPEMLEENGNISAGHGEIPFVVQASIMSVAPAHAQ
jgi:predicted RNase H-like HicB family nuclease